jgi:hypothetical protein
MRLSVALVTLALLLLPAASAVKPAAPANFTATLNPATGAVTLEWESPDSGEYSYRIYRGTTHLGDTESLTFTDDDPGLVSAYVITAVLSGEEGEAALIVVPQQAVCAPTPVQSRFELLYISAEDPCATAECIVDQGLACLPNPCEPIGVSVIPPDIKIYEECIPNTSGGSTTYKFQVVA